MTYKILVRKQFDCLKFPNYRPPPAWNKESFAGCPDWLKPKDALQCTPTSSRIKLLKFGVLSLSVFHSVSPRSFSSSHTLVCIARSTLFFLLFFCLLYVSYWLLESLNLEFAHVKFLICSQDQGLTERKNTFFFPIIKFTRFCLTTLKVLYVWPTPILS